MLKAAICVGDTTTSGGKVIEGASIMSVDGRRVSFKGAKVICEAHGMTFIAAATMPLTVEGRRIARHGDGLACGCRLVSLGNLRLHGDTTDESQSGRRGSNAHVSGGRTGVEPDRKPDEPSGDYSVAVRLLSRDGRAHPELNYVKVSADGTRQHAKTCMRGKTVSLACTATSQIQLALSIPAVEIM